MKRYQVLAIATSDNKMSTSREQIKKFIFLLFLFIFLPSIYDLIPNIDLNILGKSRDFLISITKIIILILMLPTLKIFLQTISEIIINLSTEKPINLQKN